VITIDELPEFDVAVREFCQFLRNEGHSDRLLWVFRDDTWFKAIDDRVICFPVPAGNEKLIRKVYAEARAKGLASVNALATYRDQTVSTVWFPKYEHEEVQGWDTGLKLSIRDPLPEATSASPFFWKLITKLPSFRRSFRDSDWLIGSRQWAQA
jgi:hypothetical protein